MKKVWVGVAASCIALACFCGFSHQKPQGSSVGELQEQWQFPSDHLPIGITLGDLHIVSWNVLDSRYMNWIIEKNSQGLSRSLIAEEHCIPEGQATTIREEHVIDILLQMISHPQYPKSMLCLQECNNEFMEALHARLPIGWTAIHQSDVAIIYAKDKLSSVIVDIVDGVFSSQPRRIFLDVTFCEEGIEIPLRVICAHLPGDPTQPARFEFARYLAATFCGEEAILVAGDMNFNEIEMQAAMNQAFDGKSPFTLYAPYCTNISPDTLNISGDNPGWHSKSIDHFFIYAPQWPVTPLSAEEVWPGLLPTVELLNPDLPS